MPIAFDGKLYEDEYALETGRPTEAQDASKTQGGTQVPSSENNAPASSVGAPRGILDKLLGQTGERYITWPEKAVRAGLGALALPGKVAAGEIDPASPQAAEQAFELAGLMVFGPAPVAKKMADGTLGSFIGVKAKNFDRNALAEAQVLKHNGVHEDLVFEKTGMFQGADGRWRYEIPDRDAKFNKDWWNRSAVQEKKSSDPFEQIPFEPNKGLAEAPITEVLDHPELYKAYPELKNSKVVYDPDLEGAYFNTQTKEVFVGPQYRENKGVILHELQHGIQEIEGFAKGGTYSNNFKLKYDEDILKVAKEAEALLRKPQITEADKIRAKEINEILLKNVKYREAAFAEAQWNYTRLSGEVEARNVDVRSEMSPRQSRSISPRWTEDVPRNQQYNSPEVTYATPYGYGDPMSPPRAVSANTSNKFPEGYYDKIPLEMRLSRSGTEPSHPGYRWEVYDPQTGKVMRKDIMTRSGATKSQDNLDNKYGGYKYRIREVRAKELTESEAKFLKDNNISLD